MKSITFIIFIFFLFFMLVSPCDANQKGTGDESYLNQVRILLQSDQMLERAEPFKERVFASYLDDKWIGQAVSYGCYREGQAPGKTGPDKKEILEDLNIIQNYWNLIRVYNADDDTQRILEVIRENELKIKVMLGVWLESEENNQAAKDSNIQNILRCIELSNGYSDVVTAINVGNETQVFWSGHRIKMDALIKYIRIVRNYTDVPITTADDYNFWNKVESKEVSNEVDFIATHIHPLWNGKTLDNALEWTDKTYNEIKQIHQDKTLVLGEIGWATSYNPDKKGIGEQGTLIKGEVNVEAQERFLLELDKWINTNKVITFLFEVFDEPWKGGGSDSDPREIEKHWGVFNSNRQPKISFINYFKKKNSKNEN